MGISPRVNKYPSLLFLWWRNISSEMCSTCLPVCWNDIREQRDNMANLEITFSCCFAQFHCFYISDNTCCQASECTTSSVIQMSVNTRWAHWLFRVNGYLSAALWCTTLFSQSPWRSFSNEFVMFVQNRSLKTNRRSVNRIVMHFVRVHFSLN